MSFPIGLGFWKQQSGGCPPYNPGLYSKAEIDDLVSVDGYIPVASAAEFDKIRTGNLEDMGVGTCWEGQYTTGADKKYVQVSEVDFSGFGFFIPLPSFTGVYDGNQLNIIDLTSNDALFSSSTGELIHIRIDGFLLDTTIIDTAILVRGSTGGNIEDCFVSNSSITNGNQRQSGLIGRIDAVTGSLSISNCGVINVTINSSGRCALFISTMNDANDLTEIRDCYVSSGSVTGSSEVGAFFGLYAQGAGAIKDCWVSGVSVTGNLGVGGFAGSSSQDIERCRATNITVNQSPTITQVSCGAFVGNASNCNFTECYVTGSITATGNRIGGFIGNGASVTIVDCYALVNVVGRNAVGGFHGVLDGSSTVDNCYCSGTLLGNATLNGFGVGGTVTNSYWDTTIGHPTSSTGSGQTTSALQTPTSNTGIYSAWTIPPWNFGANNEYPTLTTTP